MGFNAAQETTTHHTTHLSTPAGQCIKGYVNAQQPQRPQQHPMNTSYLRASHKRPYDTQKPPKLTPQTSTATMRHQGSAAAHSRHLQCSSAHAAHRATPMPAAPVPNGRGTAGDGTRLISSVLTLHSNSANAHAQPWVVSPGRGGQRKAHHKLLHKQHRS